MAFRVRWDLHMLLVYYLSILNSCFWHTELVPVMILPNRVCTLCFRRRKKRGKNKCLVIYKSPLTKGRKIVLLMKVSPLGLFLLAFNTKLFRWISFVDKLIVAKNRIFQISWIFHEFICAVVSINPPTNGTSLFACLQINTQVNSLTTSCIIFSRLPALTR